MADDRFFPRTASRRHPREYARLRQRARVVILPVPYDHTASGLAGARDGPRAIIDASEDMELYDLALECEPYRVGIHTLPELAPLTGDPEAMIERVEEVVGELLDGGKFVVTLGGEHTVAVGAARALSPPLSRPIGAGAGRPRGPAPRVPGHALQPRLYPAPHRSRLCPVVQVGLRSADGEEVGSSARGGSPSSLAAGLSRAGRWAGGCAAG